MKKISGVSEVLKNAGLKDVKIKLPKTAQKELSQNEVFTFFINETKLDFDRSIIKNDNISDAGKLSILNAKDSIRTKRSEIRKLKKSVGRMFDKVTAEEQLFEESTKAERAILDGYIMQTLREKAYIMYSLKFQVTEWDGENPKELQFVVKSNRITKTGHSKPVTYGIATVKRNYVQISDFIPTVDTKATELVSILNTLFYKWEQTKELCGNWKDCAVKIQDVLKEVRNSDFEQVCKWIELNVQD